MEGLIRFVKQWRHSVKIVGILSTQMAAAELFRTPEEAADAKMTELMDALHKTRFMARYRRSPQYHDPQQNDCIRGMLAMHDYLLNAARDRYPQRNYRWMHPSELRETEYILDRVFRQRTCTELLRFILERKRPSPYIALRYGWEKDVDRLDTLYREAMCADISRIHDLRKEIQQIEAPMERRTPLYEPLLSLKIRHPARSVPCRTHLEDRAGVAKDRDSPRTNDGTYAPHR